MTAESALAGRLPARAQPQAQELATTSRRRIVGVSLALFLLTFFTYWLLGTGSTPYDFQLSQANNLIHGHLDLVPQYSRNLNVLERVLYDGKGFCLPIDDPRGPGPAADEENPRFSADCKTYMQHSLGPAFLLVPLVLVFGMSVNQTVVGALIGALTAVVAFGIARKFSDDLKTQVAVTALAMFGTVLWEVSANGGVWGFAHTNASLFVYGVVYATVTRRSPLIAGALVGAAFLCRPTTILSGFFPLIAYANDWFNSAPSVPLWRRINLKPLILLALGVAPFVLVGMTVNFLRFGSPFESGYNYTEQLYQTSIKWRWPYGWFNLSYIPRHMAVVWESMPRFSSQGSFIWPNRFGQAIWATTPAVFLALFLHIRRVRPLAILLGVLVAAACSLLVIRAAFEDLHKGAFLPLIPQNAPVTIFWVVTALALIGAAISRNRLVIAAWAAIMAIAFVDWLFAATGWAQFGYRYGLDFMPFLWLLVVIAIGRRLRWYAAGLIGLAVLINLWGVLWIDKFDQMKLFGWTWVSF